MLPNTGVSFLHVPNCSDLQFLCILGTCLPERSRGPPCGTTSRPYSHRRPSPSPAHSTPVQTLLGVQHLPTPLSEWLSGRTGRRRPGGAPKCLAKLRRKFTDCIVGLTLLQLADDKLGEARTSVGVMPQFACLTSLTPVGARRDLLHANRLGSRIEAEIM